MNKLLDKIKKNSTIIGIDTVQNSKFLETLSIPTEIPALNIALSGSPSGGLSEGVTMLGGESASFKSGFLASLVKGHQNKYKDSVAIFYDSEFGSGSCWDMQGVDTNKLIHVPISTVEGLKRDIVTQLDGLELGDNVMIIIDSLSSLASKKELDDTVDGKTTVDFTRSKAINSLFRMVCTRSNEINIPICLINGHYETMEMYAKRVYSGGKRVFLASDAVLFISKAKEKDGKVLTGNKFTITIDKSRSIKEGSKFPISIDYSKGIDKYSGLFDLAVESGIIIQSGAWYQTFDKTGKLEQKKKRKSEITSPEFFEELLKSSDFVDFVKDKYLL